MYTFRTIAKTIKKIHKSYLEPNRYITIVIVSQQPADSMGNKISIQGTQASVCWIKRTVPLTLWQRELINIWFCSNIQLVENHTEKPVSNLTIHFSTFIWQYPCEHSSHRDKIFHLGFFFLSLFFVQLIWKDFAKNSLNFLGHFLRLDDFWHTWKWNKYRNCSCLENEKFLGCFHEVLPLPPSLVLRNPHGRGGRKSIRARGNGRHREN